MPSQNARRHTIPEGLETPSRGGLFATLLSVHDLIPVGNSTDRAQVLADLASAGVTPSPPAPVVVSRGDALASAGIEYTRDGSGWYSVMAIEHGGTAVSAASGYEAVSGYTAGRLYFEGPWVSLEDGRIGRSGSSVAMTAGTRYTITTAMASAYRPAREVVLTSTLHYNSGTPTPCEIIIQTDGLIAVRPSANGTLGTDAASWIAIPPARWRRA